MKKTEKILIGIILGGLIGIGLLIGGQKVLGNPSYFSDYASIGNATASTTRAYMTPGKATSTLTFYGYSFDPKDATKGKSGYVADSLTALVHVTATTGVPTLNINCEYSRDGIDYYKGNCYDTATTTYDNNLSYLSAYSWVVASTTGICATGGTGLSFDWTINSYCTRAFEVNPIAPYTRLIFSLSSTTGALASPRDDADVYAELLPIKEQK